MPLGVYTSYLIGGVKYATYVIGESETAIQDAILKRNLGETIESQIQQIQTLPDIQCIVANGFLENLPKVLHMACFLSYIALKARTMEPESIVGDEGIVHELIHLMTEPFSEDRIKKVMADMQKLQRSAIGTYEPV